MPPRRLQKVEGADDIGLNEGIGAIDRAIDMTFGRQMHDMAWPVDREDALHGGGIANIRPLEGVTIGFGAGFEGFRRGRIGQRIDIHDMDVGMADEKPHQSRTDEARSPRDQDFHDLVRSQETNSGEG